MERVGRIVIFIVMGHIHKRYLFFGPFFQFLYKDQGQRTVTRTVKAKPASDQLRVNKNKIGPGQGGKSRRGTRPRFSGPDRERVLSSFSAVPLRLSLPERLQYSCFLRRFLHDITNPPYLLTIFPIFFNSMDKVPSGLLMNWMKSVFSIYSDGKVISMPVSVLILWLRPAFWHIPFRWLRLQAVSLL